MDLASLDQPQILNVLFYPRRAEPGTTRREGVRDGVIPVADEVALGYRLYVHTPDAPLILYFHGNGEIVPDYDGIAPMFHGVGASLLVVDYRGYGWSSGEPHFGALLDDALAVGEALPGILESASVTGPLFLMGRSLGSAPAIHLAHHHPEMFRGLILESGFAYIRPLLLLVGVDVRSLDDESDPVGNAAKLAELDLPLLVIHGERDMLLRVEQGEALYAASPSRQKELLRIRRAGHNDLLFVGMEQYFGAIARFIAG